MTIKLQYISHLILQSKYKFILFLLFYVLIILLYSTNVNYTYCIESNEEVTANKYTGISLFLGSIALMLFVQKITGSIDPSTFSDVASSMSASCSSVEQITSPTIEQDPKEYLDFFNITNTGTLEITGVPIDTNNVYLNADKAITQMQQNISDRTNMLIDPIRQFHYRQESSQVDISLDSQAFIDAHTAYLKKIDNLVDNQTILLYQNKHFLNSLVEAGIVDLKYMFLYDQYLTNGGNPEQFYDFLVANLQQKK